MLYNVASRVELAVFAQEVRMSILLHLGGVLGIGVLGWAIIVLCNRMWPRLSFLIMVATSWAQMEFSDWMSRFWQQTFGDFVSQAFLMFLSIMLGVLVGSNIRRRLRLEDSPGT